MKKLLIILVLILIKCNLYAYEEFIDPNPSPGNGFGNQIVVLNNGNVVITSPHADINGNLDAGAVYLYNGKTHKLISSLYGNRRDHRLGYKTIITLPNNNVIVYDNLNYGYDFSVSLINGETGLNGTIDSTNSFMNLANQGNKLSSEFKIITLTNGNLVITGRYYNKLQQRDCSCAIWINGQLGKINCFNNKIAYCDYSNEFRVDALKDGNYVIINSEWGNKSIQNAGAVTWCDGSKGLEGEISEKNSLVGSHNDDYIGSSGIYKFENGDFLVLSPSWTNKSILNVGAATYFTANNFPIGEISENNSLIGANKGDSVGIGRVCQLKNGDYLISHSNYKNKIGALTLCHKSESLRGIVSPNNSLIGVYPNDFYSYEFTELPKNRLAIRTQYNTNSVYGFGYSFGGAITWCDGKTLNGQISEKNSLLSKGKNDHIGFNDIRILKDNNYLVLTPEWQNGWQSSVGAVTWINAENPLTGFIDETNSFIGYTTDDRVGLDFCELPNGNYLIFSQCNNIGSVTWCELDKPLTGKINSNNSLINILLHQLAYNQYILLLKNGNYLIGGYSVESKKFNIVFCNDKKPIPTQLNENNTFLIDNSYSVYSLKNGNYIITAPDWNNGTIKNAGAVTWCDGNTGRTGTTTPTNSLIGTSKDEHLGDKITLLPNGNYIVSSPNWGNFGVENVGAVMVCDGNQETVGIMDLSNCFTGQNAGSLFSSFGISTFANSQFFVFSPTIEIDKTTKSGAITLCDGTPGVKGTVSKFNSMYGSDVHDSIKFIFPGQFKNGDYLIGSENFSNELNKKVGAITRLNQYTFKPGPISKENSLIGRFTNDSLSKNHSIKLISDNLFLKNYNLKFENYGYVYNYLIYPSNASLTGVIDTSYGFWLYSNYYMYDIKLQSNDYYSQYYIGITKKDSIPHIYIYDYSKGVTAPFSQASNLQFSNISKTSMKVSWTRGTGDRCLLLAKEDNSIPTNPVADGTYYPANSSFASAGQVNGCKVVYDGVSENPYVNLTDLTPNKTYYFKALEYNNMANPLYKQNDTTGNPVSNQTLTVKENQELSINADFIYPNPTSDFIKIKLNLKQAGKVNISIIDQTGKVVKNMYESAVDLGFKELEFNLSDLASGVYLVAVTKDYESAVYTIEKMR